MSKTNTAIIKAFSQASIEVNGANPWDIQVRDERFYKRMLSQGTLGIGEAYMDGWWDAKNVDQFVHKALLADLQKKIEWTPGVIWSTLRGVLLNAQSRTGSKKVAKEHYDLSAELYMSFLDPYNQYTCGYFKDTTDLNEAQEKKLKLICDKLQLKPSDKVLDIGCGWGGFSKYAARHYGCSVTGITISQEQFRFATDFTKDLPVKIQMLDYRDLNGSYDKILCCGMMEHVGYKNYRKLMQAAHRSLKDDGLFLLHTIGNNRSVKIIEPWMDKYIFPGAMLASITQIGRAIEGLFVMEDWHNFGSYYDATLMAWYENFKNNWPTIKHMYDERFYRMWSYYLLSCAGLFRARKAQLWQIVLSKNGVVNGYQSVR